MIQNRTSIIMLGALTNAMRLIVAMLVAFCLTPVIIERTGAETFGLWILIISVLGFFALLDMGFGTAVMKFVSESRGRRTDVTAQRNRIISTFAAVYFLLLIVLFAGISIFSVFGIELLNIPSQQKETAIVLLWILSLRYLFLALPFGMFRSLLFAERMIHTANAVQIIATTVYGLLAWFALHQGIGIIDLAWISLATGLIEYAGYLILAIKRIPGLRFSLSLIDTQFLRRAASFSGSAFILQVAALILMRTDPILVQIFISLSAVAAYAVVLKISENVHLLLKQIVNVIAPLISELWGRQDLSRIRFILIHCTKYSFAAALIVCIPVAVFAHELLSFWVGPEFLPAAPVLVILMVAVAFSIPQLTATTILTMTAHHRKSTKIAIGSVILNLVLSIILVQAFGLIGVALGTLIAVIVFDIFVVLKQACKIYAVSMPQFLHQAIMPVLVPGVLQFAITSDIKLYYPPMSLSALFLQAIPGCILFMLFFWRYSLSATERQLLLASLPLRFFKVRIAG